ncbi:hypothetical protein NTE_02953 [Candidatus Nitrososphaera evergladensis SR1]|jgi:hypothetical protein|uniref:Uncharacterized protein n=1 Tax=Candidatus Nitrososphaera evergladensis SR1 TaxID=1459636 RepID=A0A075MUZ9_9ARCH|nr:hypothetical protein NTE_02953 [Candidatus Nitrososphaera evergladensis SR1]
MKETMIGYTAAGNKFPVAASDCQYFFVDATEIRKYYILA